MFFILIWGLASICFAQESERMGRFEISEFALSPRLYLQEPGQGGFALSQSWIGFEWSRDEYVRGVLKLGSSDLIAPAVWVSPAQAAAFGVSEAWMEGRSLYGDLRAGLLTIPQSFESLAPDWLSVMPETRARRHHWLIRRDFGMQFRWHTQRWDTSVTVHNGESGDNKDGRYWVTGHWGYKIPEGWGSLLTASVGRTKSSSTSSSLAKSDEGFEFDPNGDSKIRQATLAFYKESLRNLFLIEVGRGDILQGENKEGFAWGHLDAVMNWGGDGSFLFRYEQDQPNLKKSETTVRGVGMGLSISSRDNLQSWTLFANHLEENPDVHSDELWMIFRIHSLFSR